MLVELVIAFIIGVLLIAFSAMLFKLKLKGIIGVIVNALMGGIILVALNLFSIANFPINPLNALIVGFMGVFGLALIYFIVAV